MSTKFTTLQDDFVSEEWPDSRHTIRTLVEGSLADNIRAKAGREGEVVIEEVGAEGGYSEYTVEWDWTTRVEVGGVEVWSDDRATWHIDFTDEFPKPPQYSPLAGMLRWLES